MLANFFYALSYVWGTANATHQILVDGQAVSVRSNLASFLRELRKMFCPRPARPAGQPCCVKLWVDSICINQSDLHERSFQVSIMGDIFREASTVYSWLGQPSPALHTAFEHLAVVPKRLDQGQREEDFAPQSPFDLVDYESIASSSYWSRMWIQQEVLLTKEVYFVCGSHSVNWADLWFVFEKGIWYTPRPTRRRISFSREESQLLRLNMTALLQLR